MNRRTAIKQLFVVAGGIMIATSCAGDGQSTSIVLTNIKLSATDEKLLGDFVEAIIPASDSPGGNALNLHLFVMKMVDDCQTKEEQKAFIEGLKQAADSLKKADQKAILDYLNGLPKEDVFFKILKRRTVQGYLNSEYVMKNKLIYELVPGRYDGAVKVNV
ncbi:gluconate 2-dehydrogenase subunit 3 family protein [Sphingobacterium psychroaquaticum]|uniref:Gluconate 2-dehydrogenase subunit 3 n=1 Tax=Sphingobacterium psychroaquaticum TaxID=561061 RepID=A0A1X7JC91_9SPHI|nr:gluconate 2-dehydrogenase subunit 3 family protein [Sphingobacterium psychroaquaticum]SMG25471.1 Gluconate 2-dehydrogenase subunit 3 [Sphingobacterium psychroaquaticum]